MATIKSVTTIQGWLLLKMWLSVSSILYYHDQSAYPWTLATSVYCNMSLILQFYYIVGLYYFIGSCDSSTLIWPWVVGIVVGIIIVGVLALVAWKCIIYWKVLP